MKYFLIIVLTIFSYNAFPSQECRYQCGEILIVKFSKKIDWGASIEESNFVKDEHCGQTPEGFYIYPLEELMGYFKEGDYTTKQVVELPFKRYLTGSHYAKFLSIFDAKCEKFVNNEPHLIRRREYNLHYYKLKSKKVNIVKIPPAYFSKICLNDMLRGDYRVFYVKVD